MSALGAADGAMDDASTAEDSHSLVGVVDQKALAELTGIFMADMTTLVPPAPNATRYARAQELVRLANEATRMAMSKQLRSRHALPALAEGHAISEGIQERLDQAMVHKSELTLPARAWLDIHHTVICREAITDELIAMPSKWRPAPAITKEFIRLYGELKEWVNKGATATQIAVMTGRTPALDQDEIWRALAQSIAYWICFGKPPPRIIQCGMESFVTSIDTANWGLSDPVKSYYDTIWRELTPPEDQVYEDARTGKSKVKHPGPVATNGLALESTECDYFKKLELGGQVVWHLVDTAADMVLKGEADDRDLIEQYEVLVRLNPKATPYRIGSNKRKRQADITSEVTTKSKRLRGDTHTPAPQDNASTPTGNDTPAPLDNASTPTGNDTSAQPGNVASAPLDKNTLAMPGALAPIIEGIPPLVLCAPSRRPRRPDSSLAEGSTKDGNRQAGISTAAAPAAANESPVQGEPDPSLRLLDHHLDQARKQFLALEQQLAEAREHAKKCERDSAVSEKARKDLLAKYEQLDRTIVAFKQNVKDQLTIAHRNQQTLEDDLAWTKAQRDHLIKVMGSDAPTEEQLADAADEIMEQAKKNNEHDGAPSAHAQGSGAPQSRQGHTAGLVQGKSNPDSAPEMVARRNTEAQTTALDTDVQRAAADDESKTLDMLLRKLSKKYQMQPADGSQPILYRRLAVLKRQVIIESGDFTRLGKAAMESWKKSAIGRQRAPDPPE